MSAPTVTLGGVTVPGIGPVGWTFSRGVRPHQRFFEMDQGAAERVYAQREQPMQLRIAIPGHGALVVERLVIVSMQAGSRPDTRRVLVADQRYFWPRLWFTRDYNLRIRTGETRLAGEGLFQNTPLVADVDYAAWSLNGGTVPYTFEDVLTDLLVNFGAQQQARASSVQVESLIIDEPFDVALQKVLALAGGLDVTVDADGEIRIVTVGDRTEEGEIARAGPPVRGSGHISLRRHAQIPEKITVYFEQDVEVRFDFDSGITTITRDEVTEDDRTLINVLPSPEIPTASIGGDDAVPFQSWVRFPDYFNFLASSAITDQQIGGAPVLNENHIRRIYMGRWNEAVAAFHSRDSTGAISADFVRRITAIRRHWRKTFRLSAFWRQRVRNLRAIRYGIVDSETNTRGKSAPFAVYTVKPTFHGVVKGPSAEFLGWTIGAYAEDLKDAKDAPAVVTVLDAEAGVIHIEPLADPGGDFGEIAPGEPSNDTRPKANLREANLSGVAVWELATLRDDWELAVVLTCSRAVPNRINRYTAVDVTAEQAKQILGRDLGDARGPTLETKISPGTVTARYLWRDDLAAEIEAAFRDVGTMPDGALTNITHLRAIAEGYAAAEYARLADRMEGSSAFGFNPDLRVTGSISTVEHIVMPDGEALTAIHAPGELQIRSVWDSMPMAMQRQLRRLVDV